MASSPAQEKVQDRSSPHDDPSVDAARHRLTTALIDSLLHDARNPLNALSINLEVLAERLRRESGGTLAPQHDKNIKTIREQILRVDGVMKQFADFIAPRASGAEQAELSSLIQRAVEVVGHEARRRRVALRPIIEANVKIRSEGLADAQALHFVLMAALSRAIARSPSPGEVTVTLRREEASALLRIEDAGGDAADPPEIERALDVMARQHRGQASIRAGQTEVRLPL
jgi:signal transduction histidine kinase